jgi:hypothetical protein
LPECTAPMSGFAGSRSLDERRRRRLATGSDNVPLDAVAEPAPRRAVSPRVKRSRRGPAHFPLRKVISIRYWKLAAVTLCAALVGASILVGGWAAATHGEQLGPGFVLFFRLDSARLVRGFAAVGFLLAGQLALLIGWVRSQSLQDFNGRYRGWVFCAIVAFVAALGLETQLASAWSATAAWLWPSGFASVMSSQRGPLLWLVPTGFFGVLVHAYLVREMRDCRMSLSFLWLAFLLAGAAASLVLARPLPAPELQARLLECGVALLFVVCVFSSLLLHARHVVYVCVDPPAIRPSRIAAVARWFRPWAVFKFDRANSRKNRKTAGGDTVTSLKRRTPKRARSLRRKPAAPAPDAPVKEAAPPAVQPDLASVPIRRIPTAPQSLNPKKPTTPADRSATGEGGPSGSQSSAESGAFAGLSRRERKLLKKQMRTQQAPQAQLRRSA